MDTIKFLMELFVLILIVEFTYCDSQCNCSSLMDEQASLQTKMTQMELDYVDIKSRLEKLEATQRHSTRPNDQKTSEEVSNKMRVGVSLLKALFGEKRRRIDFESNVEKSIEAINASVNEFKMDSENLVRNHSNTFKEKLEQSEKIVDEVVAAINKTVNEKIQSMNVSFYGVMKDLSETKIRLSTLENKTTKNKKDGAWSSWQSWGTCSESCGGGIRSRSRTCSNPKPSLLGRYCDGTPLEMKTCNTKQCAEYNVAFTAYKLRNRPSTLSTFVFESTYINKGSGYNATTGKFTCKIPGVYHFSVTLTKGEKKLIAADPFLRINDEYKLDLFWNSHDDEKLMIELTPLTHSGTFHLNKGDVVDVYGIPTHFIYGGKTCTFTGFLITPD